MLFVTGVVLEYDITQTALDASVRCNWPVVVVEDSVASYESPDADSLRQLRSILHKSNVAIVDDGDEVRRIIRGHGRAARIEHLFVLARRLYQKYGSG